jgi:putative sigma-54 modulation protein
MQIITQTTHFEAERDLLTYVEKKVGKIKSLERRVISAEVALRMENNGQVQDKIVEVKLHMPGTQLYTRQVSKQFEAAVEKAVDTLRSQIVRYKGRNNRNRRRGAAS